MLQTRSPRSVLRRNNSADLGKTAQEHRRAQRASVQAPRERRGARPHPLLGGGEPPRPRVEKRPRSSRTCYQPHTGGGPCVDAMGASRSRSLAATLDRL
jgi:hypothetical protein